MRRAVAIRRTTDAKEMTKAAEYSERPWQRIDTAAAVGFSLTDRFLPSHLSEARRARERMADVASMARPSDPTNP